MERRSVKRRFFQDFSTEESLRGDTALNGRSLTGSLAARSKGSTRKFGPAPLILLDDADDEIKEGGVADVNQHRRGRIYNMTGGRRAIK